MAGAGAKRRAEENTRTLQRVGAYIVLCSTVYAVVRLWLKGGSATWLHWAGLGASLLAHALSYISILAVARPVYTNGVLQDGGADLSKGIISYYFDLTYVTGFVQLLASVTDYGWYAWGVVPAFGLYQVAAKLGPLVFGGKAKEQEVELDEATLKRMERTERRAERRRVKRF